MNAPLAEFTSYEELRRALNVVREKKRDMSFELLDEITGAPKGYFSKTLGPRPAKRIGLQSLGWVLGGLGVKCIIVEDPDALARIQTRMVSRDPAHTAAVRNGTVYMQVNRAHYRKIGAKGGANSRKNMTKAKARKLARKAIKARWAKRQGQAKLAEFKARKQQG